MLTEADAVVIGAGAFGLSAAFHLKKLGLPRVALLDRVEPASQTSPRAAGLFRLVQASATLTRLSALSVRKMLRFEAETGSPPVATQSGSLLVARTEAHAELIRRQAEQSRRWGIELDLVDGAEAHRLMPLFETTGVKVACHIPDDIYVEEPASMLAGYLGAALRLGVEVSSRTTVTGIEVVGGEIRRVITDRGEIRTPIVVDAAGPWARLVGELAGARVAVFPVRHQLFITEPLSGVQPTYPIVRVADAAVYVRPARGGLMLGVFEQGPLPLDPRDQAPSFTSDDVPLDESVLRRAAADVHPQVPAVDGAALQAHRGGLFTMTADGQFIAGPVPSVRGLFALTGCNGSGFSFAPALGQVLAEQIVGGAPSIDVTALSPARFATHPTDEAALQAACIHQYERYYAAH
ncbi:MAG: FAD-binding oxidoreductase [Chloroflexi bacterium]|nr:FAD-binding oxidoreductase [Chloroflexota bacterium]